MRTRGERGCALKAVPIVTILERRLESVVGLAATWFSQPVNGVIRTEVEYFIDELAFMPEKNLNARAQYPPKLEVSPGVKIPLPHDRDPITGKLNPRNSIPKADYLRFVVGYDRFFFFRPLNPANSIVLSTAFNGSINMTERRGRDFRYPNQKPGRPAAEPRPIRNSVVNCTREALTRQPGEPPIDASDAQLCVVTPPENFEDAHKFEGFLTTAFQTEYFHGRITPRLVFITDVSGVFGFAPELTYRFNDNILGQVRYLAIESTDRKALLATFRAHDMVQLRLTFQLN